MRAALSEFHILGLPTNIAFLLAVLDSPAFRAGQIDTAYLDEEGAGLAAPARLSAAAFAAAVAHIESARAGAAAPRHASLHDPWRSLQGWRS
jgi:3-methylcrotonyl-CoA carboxylase alpha subunit